MPEGIDSSTGGPLLPKDGSPEPLEDDALDDFIQAFVVGIVGMDGQWVRPRWQPEPPNLPPKTQDWAAVGVVQRTGDTYAVEEHADDHLSYVIRHETLDISVSFYGPRCQALAALLRDGLGLAQNREPLFLAGMGLVSVGELERNPELVKNTWLPRVDLPFAIRRIIVRSYDIRDLDALDMELSTEALTVSYDGPKPPWLTAWFPWLRRLAPL